MAAAARKPAATRKGKVSRAGMSKRVLDPGPVKSAADKSRHVAEGAGPTKTVRNPPVRVEGPRQSSVRGKREGNMTDLSHATTGSTIAEQANARADKRATPAPGRAVRRRRQLK